MYLVLFLDNYKHFIDPVLINKIIYIELLDLHEDLELYKLVRMHIIYYPYGLLYNPKVSCCETYSDTSYVYYSKHFPKTEQEHTQPIKEGYPLYY